MQQHLVDSSSDGWDAKSWQVPRKLVLAIALPGIAPSKVTILIYIQREL